MIKWAQRVRRRLPPNTEPLGNVRDDQLKRPHDGKARLTSYEAARHALAVVQACVTLARGGGSAPRGHPTTRRQNAPNVVGFPCHPFQYGHDSCSANWSCSGRVSVARDARGAHGFIDVDAFDYDASSSTHHSQHTSSAHHQQRQSHNFGASVSSAGAARINAVARTLAKANSDADLARQRSGKLTKSELRPREARRSTATTDRIDNGQLTGGVHRTTSGRLGRLRGCPAGPARPWVYEAEFSLDTLDLVALSTNPHYAADTRTAVQRLLSETHVRCSAGGGSVQRSPLGVARGTALSAGERTHDDTLTRLAVLASARQSSTDSSLLADAACDSRCSAHSVAGAVGFYDCVGAQVGSPTTTARAPSLARPGGNASNNSSHRTASDVHTSGYEAGILPDVPRKAATVAGNVSSTGFRLLLDAAGCSGDYDCHARAGVLAATVLCTQVGPSLLDPVADSPDTLAVLVSCLTAALGTRPSGLPLWSDEAAYCLAARLAAAVPSLGRSPTATRAAAQSVVWALHSCALLAACCAAWAFVPLLAHTLGQALDSTAQGLASLLAACPPVAGTLVELVGCRSRRVASYAAALLFATAASPLCEDRLGPLLRSETANIPAALRAVAGCRFEYGRRHAAALAVRLAECSGSWRTILVEDAAARVSSDLRAALTASSSIRGPSTPTPGSRTPIVFPARELETAASAPVVGSRGQLDGVGCTTVRQDPFGQALETLVPGVRAESGRWTPPVRTMEAYSLFAAASCGPLAYDFAIIRSVCRGSSVAGACGLGVALGSTDYRVTLSDLTPLVVGGVAKNAAKLAAVAAYSTAPAAAAAAELTCTVVASLASVGGVEFSTDLGGGSNASTIDEHGFGGGGGGGGGRLSPLGSSLGIAGLSGTSGSGGGGGSGASGSQGGAADLSSSSVSESRVPRFIVTRFMVHGVLAALAAPMVTDSPCSVAARVNLARTLVHLLPPSAAVLDTDALALLFAGLSTAAAADNIDLSRAAWTTVSTLARRGGGWTYVFLYEWKRGGVSSSNGAAGVGSGGGGSGSGDAGGDGDGASSTTGGVPASGVVSIEPALWVSTGRSPTVPGSGSGGGSGGGGSGGLGSSGGGHGGGDGGGLLSSSGGAGSGGGVGGGGGSGGGGGGGGGGGIRRPSVALGFRTPTSGLGDSTGAGGGTKGRFTPPSYCFLAAVLELVTTGSATHVATFGLRAVNEILSTPVVSNYMLDELRVFSDFVATSNTAVHWHMLAAQCRLFSKTKPEFNKRGGVEQALLALYRTVTTAPGCSGLRANLQTHRLCGSDLRRAQRMLQHGLQ